MAMGITETLAGLVVVAVLLYYYLTKNFDFWRSRGIAGPRPLPFFGNCKDFMLGRLHMADYLKSLYDAYPDEPVIGFFIHDWPMLLAKDPDVIKDVMIKSFTTFADRGLRLYEDIEPLSQHLVFLELKRWKPLRKRLLPAFSSGKIKEMFYLINECAHHFQLYLSNLAKSGEAIECREVTAKFMTDVIGMCVFGLDTRSLMNEESEFRKIGKTVFESNFKNLLSRSLKHLPYWAAWLIKPFAYDETVVSFFTSLVRETMAHRESNGLRKNDFIDLLMEIRNDPKDIGEEEMTDMLMTAQAFVFFTAGFETSSTTMSHALYELARNQIVQDKLRDEIRTAFDENNGKLNYDCLMDMKYLDKVVKETLRMYPPVFALARKALDDHTFAELKLDIPVDTMIIIPTYAIHHDPRIYPNPDKFEPERFSKEIASTRSSMSYLPFGDGPRRCIGERFAYNQIKVGLAIAVRNFKFEVCEKTCKTYVKDKMSKFLTPKNELYLNIKEL